MRITGNAVALEQFLNSWLTAGGSLDHPYMYYFRPLSGPSPLRAQTRLFPSRSLAPLPSCRMCWCKSSRTNRTPAGRSPRWAMDRRTPSAISTCNPYFVPPEPVLDALKAAALSGVDVRLMLPKKADSPYMDPANKSFFSECLSAGIRIYERGDNFMHSKTFVCDDYLSQIGTSNIDYRSFSINYEVNTFLFDEATARMNKAIFLKDLEYSTEISRPEWNHRPWYKKLVERIVRLFAPLL